MLLFGVPPEPAAVAPSLFIQNAMGNSNELGMPGFLCFRDGIADIAAGYLAGVDGYAGVVCRAGYRLSVYSPPQSQRPGVMP